jgi:hypothetical protein
MQTSTNKWLIRFIIAYQYLMPLIMAVFLFVLPALKPRPYLAGSFIVDLIVRCAIWFYLLLTYWSLCFNLLQLINKGKYMYLIRARKNGRTLSSLVIAGIFFGTFLELLTWWSLSTFDLQIKPMATNLIAIGNGVLFVALGLSQHYFLPEDNSENL